MEVYERISLVLKEQGITKKEFAKRLRAIEPRLKSTGEAPSEKTIYGYLAGRISISIELIPYIAEALRVTEQNLFTNDKESRKRFFSNILKTATGEEIEILKEKFNLHASTLVQTNEGNSSNAYAIDEEIASLLPYAPEPLKLLLLSKLRDIKEFCKTI